MNKAPDLVYLPKHDGSKTSESKGGSLQSGFASASAAEPSSLCSSHEPCRRTFVFEKVVYRGAAPSPRGGITAVCIKDTILVFGGHELKGVDQGFAYHNELYAFDTCKYTWRRIGKESYSPGQSSQPQFSGIRGEVASPASLSVAPKETREKTGSPRGTPKVRGSAPSPRYGHSAVAFGDRMIIFGGAGANGVYFNDLYAFDSSSYTWLKWSPGEEGTQRSDTPSSPTSSLSPPNSSVSFPTPPPSGSGEKDALRGEGREGPKETAPPPRMRHAACVSNGFMFIFGGVCGSKVFGDVWRFSFKSLRWQPLLCCGEGPPRRYGHQATPVGANCVVIHGGFNLTEGKGRAALRLVEFLQADAEQLSQGNGGSSGLMARIEQNGIYLQDVYILQRTRESPEEFSWFRLRTHGIRPPPRFDHTLTATGEGLLLFGGWTPQQTPQQLLLLQQQLPGQTLAGKGGGIAIAEAAAYTPHKKAGAFGKTARSVANSQESEETLESLPLDQGAFLCRSCSTWRQLLWKTPPLHTGNTQLSRRYGHATVDTPRGIFVIGGWSFPVPMMEVLRASHVEPATGAETDNELQ